MLKNLGFGISEEDLTDIASNINAVINASNCYSKKELKSTNILGTDNIIAFCKSYSKRLIHISSISISGDNKKCETLVNRKVFAENNLYVGQDLSDKYTISKFKAELKILEAIYDGLDAQILRLGNITGNSTSGSSNVHIKNNSFDSKLKSFLEIGAFPKTALTYSLEFTPIDFVSNAIIKILNHKSDCNIFHIMNPNLMPVTLLVQTAVDFGIELTPVSDRLMADIIKGISMDTERSYMVSNLLEDLNKDGKVLFIPSVISTSDFTDNYLKDCGFKWKKLDKPYLTKCLNFANNNGMISIL